MSRLVIDASMTLSWLLPDEQSAFSLEVRPDLLAAESVWVPAHWRLEVCNALWMAERRKRLDATGIAQAVTLFTQIPVVIDPETNDRAGGETETCRMDRKFVAASEKRASSISLPGAGSPRMRALNSSSPTEAPSWESNETNGTQSARRMCLSSGALVGGPEIPEIEVAN